MIDNISRELIEEQTVGQLIKLTDRDKNIIVAKKPESFYELRTLVHQLVHKKLSKKIIIDQTASPEQVDERNPELIRAARLGKHALKDPKIMIMLWNKFDKNQSSIAQFLTVNRSSVNRRCKEYGLE